MIYLEIHQTVRINEKRNIKIFICFENEKYNRTCSENIRFDFARSFQNESFIFMAKHLKKIFSHFFKINIVIFMI